MSFVFVIVRWSIRILFGLTEIWIAGSTGRGVDDEGAAVSAAGAALTNTAESNNFVSRFFDMEFPLRGVRKSESSRGAVPGRRRFEARGRGPAGGFRRRSWGVSSGGMGEGGGGVGDGGGAVFLGGIPRGPHNTSVGSRRPYRRTRSARSGAAAVRNLEGFRERAPGSGAPNSNLGSF